MAWQVTMLCVCDHVMTVVCAWVPVLLTIFTGCAVCAVRLKRKAGAGMSEDALKDQGLEFTPAEEKFVARQVTLLCVCDHLKGVVCAWVPVLLTIVTDCAG